MIPISYFIQENVKQYIAQVEKKKKTATMPLIIQQENQQYPAIDYTCRIEEEGERNKNNDQFTEEIYEYFFLIQIKDTQQIVCGLTWLLGKDMELQIQL